MSEETKMSFNCAAMKLRTQATYTVSGGGVVNILVYVCWRRDVLGQEEESPGYILECNKENKW